MVGAKLQSCAQHATTLGLVAKQKMVAGQVAVNK